MQQTLGTEPAAPKVLRGADLVAQALQRALATRGEPAVLADLRPISKHTVARLASAMRVQSATLIFAAGKLGVDLVGTLGGE